MVFLESIRRGKILGDRVNALDGVMLDVALVGHADILEAVAAEAEGKPNLLGLPWRPCPAPRD